MFDRHSLIALTWSTDSLPRKRGNASHVNEAVSVTGQHDAAEFVMRRKVHPLFGNFGLCCQHLGHVALERAPLITDGQDAGETR